MLKNTRKDCTGILPPAKGSVSEMWKVWTTQTDSSSTCSFEGAQRVF